MVNARLEAILPLQLRNPTSGEIHEVDAVIDTGYTGSLTLPAEVVASLGLKRRAGVRVVLADGSSRRLDTYGAEVEWGGSWRGVVVSALENEALIGMELLAGHQLRIDVESGGSVIVARLGPSAAAG